MCAVFSQWRGGCRRFEDGRFGVPAELFSVLSEEASDCTLSFVPKALLSFMSCDDRFPCFHIVDPLIL